MSSKIIEPSKLEERTGDRVIAEILGWRYMCEAMMIFRHDSFYEGVPPDHPEESRALVPVPLFTTRTEAALSLVDLDECSIYQVWDPGTKRWWVTISDLPHHGWGDTLEKGWDTVIKWGWPGAETLALAVCRAWLLWKRDKIGE